MKDKEKLLQDENLGFRTALFINLAGIDSLDFKKDNLDLGESTRLSIESITPGTTPKGGTINKNETDFKFCLGKDLLRRLEELSPVKIKNKQNDFNLHINHGISQSEGINTKGSYQEYKKNIQKFNYNTDNETTPTSTELATPECDAINSPNKNNFGEYINNDHETNRKVNSFLFDNSSFQTSSVDTYGRNSQYYIQMGNNASYNKFNILQNSFDLNLNPDSKKKNFSEKIPLTTDNVVINGRKGWLCKFCRNFNYESRKQCNRCAAEKNESSYAGKSIDVIQDTKSRKEGVKLFFERENCKENSCYENNNQGKKSYFSGNKKKKNFEERDGDWHCNKCRNLNFSFRISCNRCHVSRKESESLC